MKHTIFFSLALMVGMAAAQTAQQPSTNSPMQGTPQMQTNPSAAPTTPAAAAAASESATSTLPAGATISAELTKSVDAKKAKVGDPVMAKVTEDVKSGSTTVIPKGSKITGQVTSAQPHEKGGAASTLALRFDKVTLKDGKEMPMAATIQAISPPANTAANAMNEQGPGAASAGPTGNPGNMGAPGQPATMGGAPTAANGAGYPNGAPSAGSNTEMNTSGNGSPLSGVSMTQGAQGMVLTSQDHNVKLESGTQILLKTK